VIIIVFIVAILLSPIWLFNSL